MQQRFIILSSRLLILLIIVAMYSCQSGSNKITETATFDQKLLLEDLNYLIENVEMRHVDLYERANPDSIQYMKERVSSMLTKGMNRTEFFQVIGLLNPYFNDAHCLVFPLVEERKSKNEEGAPPFPFHVELDEDGVLRPERSYERVSDGSKVDKAWDIHSINGIPTSEILNKIELYSHGETKKLRRHMTTLLFSDWLFSLYGWSGEFELVFGGGSKNIQVKPNDTWKSLELNIVQYNRMEIINGNIGYLRLASFDVDEHKSQYENFIKKSFDSLSRQKVNKLIIDVRGNTGGQSDAGALVLQYLTNKNLPQVSKAYDKIHEHNAGWFNYRGKPGDIKELDLSEDNMIKPIDPKKQFKGEVMVLFDEMTYSAGIIFITTVQDNKVAHTIGRPTAGFANQTGNIEAFQLPNTKLTVYAPSRKFVRVNGNSSIHSVVPDIVVTNMDSVFPGKDHVLETSIKYLNKG